MNPEEAKQEEVNVKITQQKEEPVRQHNYFEEVYGPIGKGTERVNWFFESTQEMYPIISTWPAHDTNRAKVEQDQTLLIQSFLGRVTNNTIGDPSLYFGIKHQYLYDGTTGFKAVIPMHFQTIETAY